MKLFFISLASLVVIGGVVYLLKKKRKIKIEHVEKLTLHYVKEYFIKQEKNIIENKPIILSIKKTSDNNYGIIFEEGLEYYLLTYYSESKEEILEDNILIVATKELDSNLMDAFGNKDMIILK